MIIYYNYSVSLVNSVGLRFLKITYIRLIRITKIQTHFLFGSVRINFNWFDFT